MRHFAMYLVFAATASVGCLRSTEFRCFQNSDCGAIGVCEPVGYCSVPNTDCAGTGRSFSDSAGQGLSSTCVPAGGPGRDAGVDAPIDGPVNTRCPAPYAAVAGSAHLYKRLPNTMWNAARDECKRGNTSAYLAVPDDATELMNLATVAMATPFWIGLDDQQQNGTFMTQKGVAATFLPWANNQPDANGGKDCVQAISDTQIATEKCNMMRTAVCECEP
jgi:Lectin C-type domain